MKLYHGSITGNIKILEPRLADHDRPYVYMATIDVIAVFYLCNAVERPYYWFLMALRITAQYQYTMNCIQML